jgi:dGTPase
MIVQSVFATNPEKVKRMEAINESKYRSAFQRDRDRILYSRAFRRLAGKTQVFLAKDDDHIRNRLTHTLEVAQIAKTISKALGLNEDLTESIALGHDIGHTPFGHVGERTLNYIMNDCYNIKKYNKELPREIKGFKHNWQGIRVVSKLEDESLNLTDYTLWGILNHSSKTYRGCSYYSKSRCNLNHEDIKCCYSGETALDFYKNDLKDIIDKINFDKSWSFEGYVVAISDEIAQRHHDMEDALEYELISTDELVTFLKESFSDSLSNDYRMKLDNIKTLVRAKRLKIFSTIIVDVLTSDVIESSISRLNTLRNTFEINSSDDFYNVRDKIEDMINNNCLSNIIAFSSKTEKADSNIKDFLRNMVLNSYKAQRMDGVGKFIIKKLFKAYLDNPQQLPDKTIIALYRNLMSEGGLVDYKTNNEISVGKLRNKLEDDHNKYFTDDQYRYALLRTICDYISGMTDRYATEEHKRLYNC